MAKLPRVVIQSEISADGAIHGFDAHMGAYYGVAATLGADAEMVGSETMITSLRDVPPEVPAHFARPERRPGDHRHLWFVPDSRGRLQSYLHAFRDTEWCLDVVPLISARTPAGYREYLEARSYEFIRTEGDRVDLREALAEMHGRFGVRKVRVDSGGVLSNALLEQGLVDEISLLIAPVLAAEGREETRLFRTLRLPAALPLRLVKHEVINGATSLTGEVTDGLVHLLYEVARA